MLSVDHVTVRFGPKAAVDDVSLALDAGNILAVLGPSGCGKSTLLRAVAGLELLTSGTVAYDGQDLAGVPVHKRGFALMFQDGQLFDHQSVAENVGYPLRLRRTHRSRVAARVGELLELVGLDGYADRQPATLSGGERQRVALARALAVPPRLLLLDEPLSALDKTLRERLAGELRGILVSEGTTALLVTHDHDEAFEVADRMALMREGRLVQEGTLDEVWSAPADAEAARFLGYATVLEGERAERLLEAVGAAPGSSVALRRSALRVADAGPLAGIVIEARIAPELTRLVVDVDGFGRLDAVADRTFDVPVGKEVHLTLDLARTARPVAARALP